MVNNIVPNDIFSQHLLSKSGVYCLAVLPSEAKSPFNQWVTGGLTLFHQTGMVQPQVVEVV